MLPESARWASEGMGVLGAAALAAGACAYHAMVPRSQLFGATLIAPQVSRHIALTFDDGPNPAWTPKLLDVLATYKVKATFFLVGKYVEAEPYLARFIAESGHLVGSHSWSHPNLALSSPRRVRDELQRSKREIEYVCGVSVRFFRPPFGARRPDVLNAARELGMIPVMWNAMTSDWKNPSAERIAERLSMRIDALGRHDRAASVVLHDGGHLHLGADRGPSVRAAELLLERYAGVKRFVTVDAWA